LSHGLRDVLRHGSGVPVQDTLVLIGWAAAAVAAAAATFRWE